MFTRSVVLLTATLLSSLALAAETPVVDQRLENQEKRIENGVKSEQLNQREAARLGHAEDRLQANVEKAKADGKVTAAERARLNREARVNSARIARQKHDAQGDRTRDVGARNKADK